MRGLAGSTAGVAAGMDEPGITARGGEGGRRRRSKQASRRAAIHRQMTRIINEHNTHQRETTTTTITGKNNEILEIQTGGTRMIGMIGGQQEAREWMRRRLGTRLPDRSDKHVESVVNVWEIPNQYLSSDVLRREELDLTKTLQKWYVPRYGTMTEEREEGVFRIMGGQLNSMGGSDVRTRKVSDIVRLTETWDIQGGCFCEVGVNWARQRYSNRFQEMLRSHFEDIRAITDNNTTENISSAQVGGVAQFARGNLVQYARAFSGDFRGLGRWISWLFYSDKDHATRVIAAYNLAHHTSTKPGSAYQQYTRYLQNNGITNRTPRSLFHDDFVGTLRNWIRDGERLLVFIDLNEHILTSRLARDIMGLGLEEATHRQWPEGVQPHTYIRGSGPIDAVYHSPELEIISMAQLSFHEGVGDHRTVIVDVSARSMIGRDSFKIVRPTARRLTLVNKTYVKRYVSILEGMVTEHKLHQKLDLCAATLAKDPDNTEAKKVLETIDKEVTQFQKHAEKKCRKIYKQPLEFSLPVQHWVRKRWGYQGLLRLFDGRCSNPGNIRRMARKAGITEYKTLTHEQVLGGITFCTNKLRGMKGNDRQLRKEHLATLQSAAYDNKDKTKSNELRRVVSSESQKAIWQRINKVTNPPRGGAIQKVQKEHGDELVELVTLDEMSREIQTVTEERFGLAESASAFSSSLRSSVGFLADTDFALHLLSGDAEIPEDVDSTTFMLLTEMRRLWQSTGEFRSKIFEILPRDYDHYWRRARERTSSSFANIHFGHWKAAIFSTSLKEFFAAKLTVVGRYGSPPSRWSSGLQVMLEKVAGVALVNKLRAILLMEGDFNFFNKWTFGHMAMNELYRLEYIPQDQYSQRGSTAEDARMDSRLTTDLSRQLRHPMAIAAVDADQCYDRINHIIMSLVLLAVVGGAGAVVALLRPIQTMKFYQRTAWGDSSSFMGGRGRGRPLHGLCQGNGAAPACWLMLSSLLMHCYHRQGFGSKMLSPISGLLLEFMGEMFVDDTDLIVMRPDLRSGRAVYEELQSSAWNWGINLNATGGGLKGSKCYWWLVDYEWINGEWRYSAMVEWDLVIPLPDGTFCTIEQVAHDKSMKMLGVWSCPAGVDTVHLQEIVIGKMKTWIDRTRNGHLPATLVWRSYKWKLWPGLRYGLATLGTPLSEIGNILNRQEFDVLPLLGINRNIRRRWRSLPHAFGGAGLFNLQVEQTIGWINMFLQHFGLDSTLARKFMASLEALQLELGCIGCPFEENFGRFGHLATASWVKSFWERLSYYNFTLHVKYPKLNIPREGDATIISLLSQAGHSGTQLRQLNRCRLYLKAIFISDLTSANGRSFLAADPDTYGATAPRQSPYTFPQERPSVDDWTLWYGAWRKITSTGWVLNRPLGRWLHRPDAQWHWYYDEMSNEVWELGDSQQRYTPIETRVNTRSHRLFKAAEPQHGHVQISSLKTASVSVLAGEAVILHDIGPPMPHEHVTSNATFWEHLRSQGGEWMWDHVTGNQEMEWFHDALADGTAMMAADGSYSRDLDRTLSGTGWAITCTRSKHLIKGSFFERSMSASSYRGELLGMVAIHALVATAAEVYNLRANKGSIHCDNMGALGKARAHGRRVKSSLRQGDLVRAIRSMKQGLFLQLRYQYVKSHQDDNTRWEHLPLDQKLNVMCDTLAKQAVGRGLSIEAVRRRVSPLSLPWEHAAIMVGGEKLTSDVSEPIRFYLGHLEARRFYTQPKDIRENGVNRGGLGWMESRFDMVDWRSLHDALSKRPEMFRVWLAKQCMGVNATRRNMARITKEDDDICPNCKLVRERSDHLNQCTDNGRTTLYDESVNKLEAWLTRGERTEPELSFWIVRILRLRGSYQEVPWDHMSDAVKVVVQEILCIGWTEFLQGKIPLSMTTLQGEFCTARESTCGMTGQSWARSFIYQLLQISHSQWLYRNFTLHHRTRGYLATKARLEILERISDLADVRATDIPEESAFLLEIDFKGLVLSKLSRQVYWVAAMQAAIKAGRNRDGKVWRRKSRKDGEMVTRGSRGVELSGFRHQQVVQSMFRNRDLRRQRVAETEESTNKRQRTSSGSGDVSREVSR